MAMITIWVSEGIFENHRLKILVGAFNPRLAPISGNISWIGCLRRGNFKRVRRLKLLIIHFIRSRLAAMSGSSLPATTS
jgi:hypothetical protein